MPRSYTLRGTEENPPLRFDFSRLLNPEQLAAVETQARHALVIAGAGSGKTRTLTCRAAHLLAQGVAPWRLLLLTFTNKAAREMMERVRSLVPGDLSSLWGGTFHSVANRVLRRHAALLGYTSSFVILDTEDRKALLRRLVKEYGGERKAARFPKPELLSSLFSLACNRGREWREVLMSEYYYLHEHEEKIALIHKAFQKTKKADNAMDFDDLLLNAVTLLEEHAEVRELYQNQFAHVLVDEYQDTNSLQDRLVDLLVGGDGTALMAVGDDAQSIYSWRGADVRHILEFQERFPDAEVFKIETNYRSVPSILELSNAAIAANTRCFVKKLRPARRDEDMLPALVPAPDARVEALFVAQRIGELIASGVRPREIAVLYRSHYLSLDVQMALSRAHIPFRVTSGVRFFEQAHVKDVMALVRLAVNPWDQSSLLRLVQTFPKVGAVTASRIWSQWSQRLGVRGEAGGPASFAVLFGEVKTPSGVRPFWDAFLQALDSLRDEDGHGLPPAQMIARAVEYLDPSLQHAYEDYEERRSDLETLARAASDCADADEFLAQTALLSNTDQDDNAGTPAEEVCLSTVHQAKGLEWRVVFIISLCEGSFPNHRVLDGGDPDALEEELRLFYVAVTRAEDQLYLSYPKINLRSGDGSFYQYPSRFLGYCPAELLEHWEI